MLDHYQVLGTERDAQLDAIATLAAHVARVSIAAVALVDAERVWLKARHGLALEDESREGSPCDTVVRDDAALTCSDVVTRFASSRLAKVGLRFFSGRPIRTPEGLSIGVLLVADQTPRTLDAEHERMLDLLAGQAMAVIELGRGKRDRFRLEQSLRKASDISAQLGDANYVIVETTPEGAIRGFNSAAERMLGYAPVDVIGASLTKVHHAAELKARAEDLTAELGEPIKSGFDALVAKARRGSADVREWTYVRQDGKTFPVELSISARRDVKGTILGYVVIAADIGERKRVEARLRQSEARSRSIIDTAIDAIITIDARGHIHHVNPAVERLFGHSSTELLAESVNVLMPPPKGEAPDDWFAAAASTGGQREVVAVRKDGSQFPAELAVSEFQIDQKRYFTGVIRDISDRLAAQRAKELERVERLQSEFVSTVSHELRTPLTSIRGALGLVAAGVTGPLPKEAKEYVDIALSNADRLVRLINDILDIEKMQSGSMEFRYRTVDLGQVVKSAIAANEAFAAAHRVKLSLTTAIPPGEVLVDPDRLIQVLTNLISNATKFSPPDASVELRVDRILDRFRVGVRDHGPGIPEEFKERIFQRFAQADSSTTRKKGGTGLGLSISKTILANMGGQIGFEPADGGGTTFFFDLPFLPPVADERFPANTTRVLVCEDDPDVARHLEKLLGGAGFEVHLAPTLERARRLLAAHRFEAVTLDLVLADGDGTELIHELRSAPATLFTPIVVVSGANRQLGQAAVMVTDVLVKPFDEQRLLAAVKNAVAGCRSDTPRLLHVEDDEDTRRVVRRTLPASWTVFAAESAADARAALLAQQFDVVLLDLALPDGAGDELIGLVGHAHVIIFSASDAPAQLSRRVSAALVKSRSNAVDVRDTIVSLIGRKRPAEEHEDRPAAR